MNPFKMILSGLVPILLSIGVTTVSAPVAAKNSINLAGAPEIIAAAAAAAAQNRQAPDQGAMPSGASYWKAAEAFAKGGMLVEGDSGGNYKVYAGRRDKPGTVEVHALDSDIIFVLDGSATFVTGGSVIDARQTGPETIGTAIRDGEARQIAKGDMVLVPKGTPHWFQNVNGVITYYAVKLR